MKIRRINNAIHRDLGYFFFGMCIIYGLSGIALNHRHHWNPNFIIKQKEFELKNNNLQAQGRELALDIIEKVEPGASYKTHLESGQNIRIFIDGGTINFNLVTGKGNLETIKKRPVFNQVNFLHYNTPKKLWTWFSDSFAVGLIILAITGLFVLRGKNGLAKRGVYFVVVGIFIPLVFLYLYLSV